MIYVWTILILMCHQVVWHCSGFQVSVPAAVVVGNGQRSTHCHQRVKIVDASFRSNHGGIRNTRDTFVSMTTLSSAKSDDEDAPPTNESLPLPSSEDEERAVAVGNLVVDDEWEGLTMELSDVIRKAVMEDLKSNAREFLGKDQYELGDVSKEIDQRVKQEVANLRGKERYELGDLVLVVDTMAKNMTSELTGRPYVAGDLSVELDRRIKDSVAKFCSKDSYTVGDLSKEIDRRVKARVATYLKKDSYEIGDISKEIENKRRAWVKEFLGEEAANEYKFGDITKKALANFTGKDTYKFGDITKKLMGGIFKKKN